MAAFVSAGGSISWGGLVFTPRSISFKSAQAEVVEIPYLYQAKNTPPLIVPTGLRMIPSSARSRCMAAASSTVNAWVDSTALASDSISAL